jgi:hypothetical protein
MHSISLQDKYNKMIRLFKKIWKAVTTDKEKNLQAPAKIEELSDGEAVNVVGGHSKDPGYPRYILVVKVAQ